MNLCNNCFKSNYLQDIINQNSEQKGTCDFCKSKDVNLIKATELKNLFQALLENYVLCSNNIKCYPIDVQISKDFPNKIFADESFKNVRNILYAIFKDEQSYIEKFLQNKVCLEYLQTGGASGDRLIDVWNSLSEEIKYTNRFLINKSIDLKLLEKVLERHIKIIKKDSTFYRGRISDKNGLKTEEMWNPPNKKASAGRANPKGISYLYLCMDEETTLYEVRALLYDFVTIAKYKNKVQIKIINLNETEIYDPLQLAEVQELSGFLQHLPFIKKLSDDCRNLLEGLMTK